MKKKLMPWLLHALHWVLLYLAFFQEVDGAMYTLKFWVWALLPLSVLIMVDEESPKRSAKEPRTPVFSALTNVQSWATLSLLVWFGHIFSGMAWAAVMLFVAVHRKKTQEARAAYGRQLSERLREGQHS